VYEFVGQVVEANAFSSHGISELVAEFFVGNDIETREVRGMRADIYIN
jgi:hypothetical protein